MCFQENLDNAFDAGGKVAMGLTATTLVSQWTWAATLLQSSTVASKVTPPRPPPPQSHQPHPATFQQSFTVASNAIVPYPHSTTLHLQRSLSLDPVRKIMYCTSTVARLMRCP